MSLAEIINATEANAITANSAEKSDAASINALSRFLTETHVSSSFSIWVEHFADRDDSLKLPLKLWISRQIGLIDELINEQLNAIIHDERFQALESSWLSLHKLAIQVSQYPLIELRVLNITWSEITKDINRSPDFDQSYLFQRIYTEEFGTAGGKPYGLIIGDFTISHRPFSGHRFHDIETLKGLAQIGAAAFSPIILAAAPQLFGLDDFTTLGQHINLQSIFNQDEYFAWNSLRELEDSRFLGITLPRLLLRKPYNESSHTFDFKEYCQDHDDYLWGNASFAFANIIAREFGEIGWFAQTRGTPRDHKGGGLLTEYESIAIDATNQQHIVTEVAITDTVERELNDIGLMSLCQCYATPFAAFHSNPSLHSPKSFKLKSASANARIGAMLQQIFCASRFAHYIKIMIRDKIGSFATDKECERHLQKWLDQYTTGLDDVNWEVRAEFPLRSARVYVKEKAGSPGVFNSVIYLKPHYIAENLISELKLTTELTATNSRL